MNAATSSSSDTPMSAMCSPDSAVTVTGTSSIRCARFCAVTMTSPASKADPSPSGCALACASAPDETPAPSVASTKPKPNFRIFLFPPNGDAARLGRTGDKAAAAA